MKNIPELTDVTFDCGMIANGQLCLRFESTTIKGYELLRDIGESIKRPVDTFGTTVGDKAYLWIEIPVIKENKKRHHFGNMPQERKAK